jgi:predicted nucleotidyltransferase
MIRLREINIAVRKIAEQFRPERITLFGSYAYGSPDENSDVDLLILMKGRRVHQKDLQIRLAIDFGFPVDLIVRSPDEYYKRIAMDDFFLMEIEEMGKVLYDASDARMGTKRRGRLSDRSARAARSKVTQSR